MLLPRRHGVLLTAPCFAMRRLVRLSIPLSAGQVLGFCGTIITTAFVGRCVQPGWLRTRIHDIAKLCRQRPVPFDSATSEVS